MEGIVFYDEMGGVAPLKSTITNRGSAKLRRLDKASVKWLATIAKLDPKGSDYPIMDETTMRVIDSICKADVREDQDDVFPYWYKDYSKFAKIVEEKWNLLRSNPGVSTPVSTPPAPTAWRPAPHRQEPQPEYFTCEGKGFFLLPVESLVPCLRQFDSMVRLWGELKITGEMSDFHTITNTKDIKIFEDSKNKLVHIAYPLHREGNVILARLKGTGVQTFEVKLENESHFVISMETPTTTTMIKFFKYPEWGIDEAYDMLFGSKSHKSLSSVIVELKNKF